MKGFVHLHLHTEFSILDGAIKIEPLMEKVKGLGMPAVAITDHGNMFGAIEFYDAATKYGIKPIIGCELYVSPTSRFDKSGDESSEPYHLVCLAKNEVGYKNLMRLTSIGYLEGFYYKPRVDKEVLRKYSEGLIALSACVAGEIPKYILKGRIEKAVEEAIWFRDVFGEDNFYLELQYHGLKEQKIVNEGILEIHKRTGIPIVATNDAHYLEKEDAKYHDVLLCIQTQKLVEDENRLKFGSDEFYVKSYDEMYRAIGIEEALRNTLKIADMVELNLRLGENILPDFKVPDGHTVDSYFKYLVSEGMRRRFGYNIPKEVKERIEYEVDVIVKMGFSGYFLIVWDFINYAKKNGIPVGPGRGSAAGSLVSYVLGITEINPLEYGLIFERFLNPERKEFPDIDVDICKIRRDEVIKYIERKYGKEKIAQIITFNNMKAKAVLKDVARAYNVPFKEANEMSSHIPFGMTLKEALGESEKLREYKKKHSNVFEVAEKLEGFIRNPGKHAAGIVIGREELLNYVPLFKDSDGNITTQYNMNSVARVGLVKMDLLGLANLTIIDEAIKLIKRHRGIYIDIDDIPLTDRKTYELLRRGETLGVFQLESKGIRELLRKFKPQRFTDLIAILALYRPGPLRSGMVDEYIKRKEGEKPIEYPDDSLKEILEETYGVIVYQEQVMKISQVIAGFSMAEADRLRKAMGKKKKDIMEEMREKFIKQAVERGYDKKKATDIFSTMERFAEYGFNKSHSTAYALISYRTAYLKANYPTEYLTALLNSEIGNEKELVKYINECKKLGIEVLPVDINKSDYFFTIEGERKIRFGLAPIKNLGDATVRNIIDTRKKRGEYKDIFDFVSKVNLTSVNRRVLENLIKAGAFDSLHKSRKSLVENIMAIIKYGADAQEIISSAEGGLFGETINNAPPPPPIVLDEDNEWDKTYKLSKEREVLGFYLTDHPMKIYSKYLRKNGFISISALLEQQEEKEVSFIGVITNVSIKKARGNKKIAIVTIEDEEGIIDVIVWNDLLQEKEKILREEKVVEVKGLLEILDDKPKSVVAKEIREIRLLSSDNIHNKEKNDSNGNNLKSFEVGDNGNNGNHRGIKGIYFVLDDESKEELLFAIREEIINNPGDTPIFFHIKSSKGEFFIKAHSVFNIKLSDDLLNRFKEIVGHKNVYVE
jgi:DNA polymerase-3 subunit alpha